MDSTHIGIRREDKNRWERRVPLTPEAVAELVGEGLRVTVQPSPIRVFPDQAYREAGAQISEDLTGCGLVLAVKEIPAELIGPDQAYVFFSHTIKGQAHNMPLLRRVIDERSTLMDYERVVGPHHERLIHFGRFAGIAGAIDGLWALGRRYQSMGLETPLAALRPAWAYPDLAAAYGAVRQVGSAIADGGLPAQVSPLVVGVTGYGNVGRGALEALEHLPLVEVDPAELGAEFLADADPRAVYWACFREEHTVENVHGEPFDLAEYWHHPGRYRSTFQRHLPWLSLLVHCIYWDENAPRLVRVSDLKELGDERKLAVIADVSCDIDGGMECTVRSTTPDEPVYVYDPATGRVVDGVDGDGLVVLAVDHLPCEVPKDSSQSFSEALLPWIPRLAAADYSRAFEDLRLPPEWKGAVIAHQGRLAPAYDYLRTPLAEYGGH